MPMAGEFQQGFRSAQKIEESGGDSREPSSQKKKKTAPAANAFHGTQCMVSFSSAGPCCPGIACFGMR